MSKETDDESEIIDIDETEPIETEPEKVDRGDEVTPDDEPEPAQPEAVKPEKGAEAEASDEPAADVPKTIPKSRFDEVNERMKTAEARLAEIDAQRQAKAQETEAAKSTTLKAELAEKTRAYHQALIDGEFDSVDRLALELDDVREQITESRAREIASKEIAEVRIKDQQASYADRVTKHATKIAEENPFLLDGSDPEASELFELVRDGALAKGKDNIAAMDKALAAVLKLRGQEAPVPKPSASDALMRKLAAAKKQPPRPIGVGNRAAGSTTPTKVSEMDEEEFAKIPAAEKRRLRGDII